MTSMRTSHATRAALIVGAAALALAACGKKEAVKTPADLAVSVAPLQMRTLEEGISASGVLVSREEAVVAPQISGFAVAKVLIDQDTYVTAGQPMAQLDDTLLKSQIAQQTAAVQSAQVQVDQAQAEVNRVAGLDNSGVLSNEQIEQRRLSLRTAQAQLASVQAGLKDSETRQGLMTVRAPVAGRVLTRTVRPGDVSSPASPMFTIARDGLIEVNADLSETQLRDLKPGDRAVVTLASGATAQGAVRLISPQVDPQTRLGHVLILIGANPQARPGGFAKAQFSTSGGPVLTAPEKAVTFTGEGATILVLGDGNKVAKVPVTAGRHSGGYVELTKGPPAGACVVLGGSAFLLPGDVIRPSGPCGASTGAPK
ncbi:MAG: Multidrug resistance protein MdtA [Caulobacteraceae bacterium]|nr:Multidrug resistance protein MdtA [Caulobacteraceae bacterium]